METKHRSCVLYLTIKAHIANSAPKSSNGIAALSPSTLVVG
jgi:hypothetical protein